MIANGKGYPFVSKLLEEFHCWVKNARFCFADFAWEGINAVEDHFVKMSDSNAADGVKKKHCQLHGCEIHMKNACKRTFDSMFPGNSAHWKTLLGYIHNMIHRSNKEAFVASRVAHTLYCEKHELKSE